MSFVVHFYVGGDLYHNPMTVEIEIWRNLFDHHRHGVLLQMVAIEQSSRILEKRYQDIDIVFPVGIVFKLI